MPTKSNSVAKMWAMMCDFTKNYQLCGFNLGLLEISHLRRGFCTLRGELGVAEADIEVLSLEAAEFTDSCLGLGQSDESCLQAITPG